MPRLLLILPFLAHVLMGAHLMFHGFGAASFLLIIPAMLLFVPKHFMARLQQAMLLLWAAEWIRSGILLVMSRLDAGRPWQSAALIMLGVAAATALTALVFQVPYLRRWYKIDR